LFDAVRGNNRILYSNATNAEEVEATASLTSFNSDGFTLSGNGSSGVGNVNGNGTTYAAWTWDAGSSTVTNTQGSITSSVRANATAGFSIVTYTGTGSNATVGHGLGVAPGMIVIKDRTSSVFNWAVWHSALGGGDYALQLNNTSAKSNAFDYWNGDPTSTVFTLGTDNGSNKSGDNYVAYCFAPVVGYSSFGSYTGNGSSDGPFVYTGFRPRWLLIKCSSVAGESWFVLDSARSAYNVTQDYLVPNSSASESSAYNIVDFLSNGFKLKTSAAGSAFNGSGATYIYAAFAEAPFNYSRAR
jgi:hypothetical protein